MPTKRKRYNRKAIAKDGRTKWVSGYTPEEANHKKQLAEAEMNGEEAERLEPLKEGGSMLFRKWIAIWEDTYLENKEKVYRDSIHGYIRNAILPELSMFHIDEIKQIHIQKLFNKLQDKSRSYNHKVYGILKQIFTAAEDNDLIQKSPMRTFKQPKGKEPKERRSLTEEERAIILKVYGEDLNDGLFLMIMLYTGLRPQEVAALTWDDIDFENKYLTVNKALKEGGYIDTTKSKAGIRSIPIPDKLYELLERKKDISESEYVLTHSKGMHHTKNSLRQLRERVFTRVNLELGAELDVDGKTLKTIKTEEGFSLYVLRHTYATDLEKKGVPINIARVLMGHSDISITSKVYTHTDIKAVEGIRDLLNK